MSLAAHKRWTVAFDTPAMRAIVRQLHRPSVAGGVTALSRTTRTASSGTEGLRPRPVASSNPARRLARNRWHQRLTVTRDTPTRAAIWCCEIPAALRTTISARCRSLTATVDALIRRSNSPLSWPLSTILLRHCSPQRSARSMSKGTMPLSSYLRDTTRAELHFIGDQVVCLSHDQAGGEAGRREPRRAEIEFTNEGAASTGGGRCGVPEESHGSPIF